MLASSGIDRISTFFQPILFIIGVLLLALAASMCIPAIVDMVSGNPRVWVFPVTSGITLFAGGMIALSNRSPHFTLSIR